MHIQIIWAYSLQRDAPKTEGFSSATSDSLFQSMTVEGLGHHMVRSISVEVGWHLVLFQIHKEAKIMPLF